MIIIKIDSAKPCHLSTNCDINKIAKTLITDAAREDEDALPPRCISEMEAHRRQLMNDFQISPELVVNCAKDIQVLFWY